MTDKKSFEVVYYETIRISRTVEAHTPEEAIAISEQLRDEQSAWDDCDEVTQGTVGVEEVWCDGQQVWRPEPTEASNIGRE